jgi:phenylpropionate dioxygenase-like ring-hydroxylating dioxygenase large terminal subunit
VWSYTLDGRLLGAPGMEGARGFERAATRLSELRSEVWQGFLFVNPEADAKPLAPRLAALDARLASFRLGELNTLATLDYDSPWDWKVMLEERHRVRGWLCAPEAVRAELDFEAKLAASRQLLDAIHREDMATCAAVQRGLGSRLATPGALPPLEGTLAHFQRWWLARMR